MKAVDTNILVYAHRAELPQHLIALKVLNDLAQTNQPWFIPWPCAYEFYRIVTHSKVFKTPSSRKVVLEVLSLLIEESGAQMLGHGPAHFEQLARLSLQAEANANLAFDVQIASILLEHGISTIITNDGDFLRFKDLVVENPFI
jgi:uncharacterized protein